jgi:hypothetical protein
MDVAAEPIFPRAGFLSVGTTAAEALELILEGAPVDALGAYRLGLAPDALQVIEATIAASSTGTPSPPDLIRLILGT